MKRGKGDGKSLFIVILFCKFLRRRKIYALAGDLPRLVWSSSFDRAVNPRLCGTFSRSRLLHTRVGEREEGGYLNLTSRCG